MWDCYAYTFIGVRIPITRLWEKNYLKKCECYDEYRYCEECSGEYIIFPGNVKYEYGCEMLNNDVSKKYMYICISKDLHNCKDEKCVIKGNLELEELIHKRELLKTILLKEHLLKEDEFEEMFGIYTRANYDY